MESGTPLRAAIDQATALGPAAIAAWALACVAGAAWVRRKPHQLRGVLYLLAVGGALGFLTSIASVRAAPHYYKYVDEVTADPAAWRGKHLYVHGNLVEGSLERARDTLRYRFVMDSRPPRPPATLMATYTGLLPDAFCGGAEIVVRGTLGEDGRFDVIPDGIMAKCPGKYEAGYPRPCFQGDR